MGQFAAPYGVRGFSRIRTFTESPDSLMRYPEWWVGGDAGFELRTCEAEMKGGMLTARLEGVADREGAQAIIGREIAVIRDALPDAAEGEYYWADLVGLDVVNLSGEGLGKVDRLFSNGANDVIVVAGDAERLIPCVDAYVREVDLASRRIVVDWGKDY